MAAKLLILFLELLLTHASGKCRRTFKLTDEFCANIPTTKVDVHAFAGVWFQIFLTTGTDINQLNKCTTLDARLQRDGSFEGLNCEFDDFLPRPRCIGDTIKPRPGGGPGSFLVFGGPTPANLDFIALLGSKSYGYFAAAAFQCNSGHPRTPGYFILARKPFLQKRVLRSLKKKLRCLGFPLPKTDDFKITQVKGCKYFFNKGGFDIVTPADLMNS